MVQTSEQNGLPIDDVDSIEGVVERIVYENRENGFFVARLQEAGKRGLTTFVGNLMAVSPVTFDVYARPGNTARLDLRGRRWVTDVPTARV